MTESPAFRILARAALAAAAFCAAAALVHADWQGDLKAITPSNELEGDAHVRDGRLRVNVSREAGAMSYIVDPAGHRSIVLAHKAKTATVGDLGRSRVRLVLPQCQAASSVEACLKNDGYKKAGSEAVNGYPCTIYERRNHGALMKLWRPTEFAELVVTRLTSFDESGSVLSQSDITNIKVAAQDEALFSAPADYRVTTSGR